MVGGHGDSHLWSVPRSVAADAVAPPICRISRVAT